MNDGKLVQLAQQGNERAVRILIQRHNRRLFRVARAVTADDMEAEDAVQEAYVNAFTHLSGFRGEAAFSTWLTRIVLNEALGRLRRRRPGREIAEAEAGSFADDSRPPPFAGLPASPESEAARRQVRQFLERAVDELPEPFRTVFVMRDVEGLSVKETAALLRIHAGTVKTRLHRARRQLRRNLERELAPRFAELFPFGGARCARIGESVVQRLFRHPSRHAS